MTGRVDLVADTRDRIGESPIWCARTRTVVWTDIAGRRIHRLDIASARVTTFDTSLAIGCIATARDGEYVAATEDGFAALRLTGAVAELTLIAPVLRNRPTLRFNDGRCDRSGRFLASSMAWTPQLDDAPGALWRLDARARTLHSPPLVIPNGMAFSPAGDRLYLSDSHPSRAAVWVFDYDPDDGVPSSGRPFLDMRMSGGRPDGAAVDTDGGYWIAASDAGEVRRYTPAGRLDRVVLVPVPHPTTPVFGGGDLHTLFIASARRHDASPTAPDGGLFALRVAQQGVAETPWSYARALSTPVLNERRA